MEKFSVYFTWSRNLEYKLRTLVSIIIPTSLICFPWLHHFSTNISWFCCKVFQMCQIARFSENVENLQPSDDRELNDSKLIISLEWMLTTFNPSPNCLKK